MVFQPFQPHPVFDTLRQDPAAASGLTVLIGYPTESDRGGGHRRLYLTPDLSAYVDIPSADIVGTQPLPAEQFPLGETVVWVKRDAQLHYTQTTSQQVQAGFLQGEIARAHLPQSSSFAIGAASGLGGRQMLVSGVLTSRCEPATVNCSISPYWCQLEIEATVRRRNPIAE